MFLNRAGVQNVYSHKVRIGNWSEEQELEELRMKEYIHRKEKGQLLVHRVQKHMNGALQEVGLSYCPDGVVHIGDHVMLYSVATSGVLSADPADRVASSDRAFGVTTSSLVKAHVARNTFVIEAYGDAREAPVGSVLRLGQQFRLRLNPVLEQGQPFYLQSQPVSSLAASKVSHKQLVCMSSVKSFDSVWRASWKDISRRFEQDGQPVPANGEVVLVHAPTNTALSSAPLPYYNDFGAEWEVCAHSHIDIRKSQGLLAEMQGRTTSDIPCRKESSPNHWAFLTAATEDRAEPLKRSQQIGAAASAGPAAAYAASSASAAAASSPQQQQQQNLQLSSVLLNVREDLVSRGPEHLFSLLRSARTLDAHRSGHVSYDDFRKLLLTHGLRLSLSDFDSLCRLLDPANDKHVDYRAFIAAVRGPMSPRREDVVARTFAHLDPSSTGSVALATLQSAYDPQADPDVALARKGQAAARDALMVKMRALSREGRVAREDFTEHYAIVSAFVESDDYFDDLLTRSWKGNAAASARRQ